MATPDATIVKPKPKAIKAQPAAKAPKKPVPAKIVAKVKPDIESDAAAEPVAPKSRRKPKAEIRTRIYWGVFNQSLKRVAVFEFDQKGEAEKRAVKLHKSSGEQHFIQKLKAVVQSDN